MDTGQPFVVLPRKQISTLARKYLESTRPVQAIDVFAQPLVIQIIPLNAPAVPQVRATYLTGSVCVQLGRAHTIVVPDYIERCSDCAQCLAHQSSELFSPSICHEPRTGNLVRKPDGDAPALPMALPFNQRQT
eukprot:7081806-Prymnesium_polylepis.1